VANKKASKKSAIQSQKRAAGNRVVHSRLKTLSKKLQLLESGKGEGSVQEVVASYVSALDKAAKRNIIHKNSANRHKSRVARYIFK
jgi:small subunit ribosomal protein S20